MFNPISQRPATLEELHRETSQKEGFQKTSSDFARGTATVKQGLTIEQRCQQDHRRRRSATPTKPANISKPEAGSGTAVTRMIALGATVDSELTP